MEFPEEWNSQESGTPRGWNSQSEIQLAERSFTLLGVRPPGNSLVNPPVKVSQNSDPLTELSSLHAFNAWVHTSIYIYIYVPGPFICLYVIICVLLHILLQVTSAGAIGQLCHYTVQLALDDGSP